MFLLKPVTKQANAISETFKKDTTLSKQISLIALLASLAAFFQSAGGLLPVIGLLISPFATAPILISSVLSIRFGFLSYIVTIFLLLIIQPSELIIFPFTTGLLGIGIGFAFHVWERRFSLIITGALSLLAGILLVFIIFQFPLLGPSIHPTASIQLFLLLAFFPLLYSWLWVELSVVFFNRLHIIFFKHAK